MDKALDDIIATRPRARRAGSRRGSGRAAILGNPVASPTQRTKAAATKATATSTSPAPADKIIVSNLPQDVNEAQIKELFHATVGPLRDVTLHYDASGRSKGVAAIHFQRKGDGTKAYQQYNNRLIDGKPGVCVAPDVVEDHARPSARPRALPIWMLRWRIILQAMRPPLRNFFLFPYKFLEEDHYRLPYRLTFCVCASVILCTQVLGVYSVRNQPLVLHFRPYPPPIELIARSVFLHCTYVLCFVGSFYLYGFALIQKNRAHYSIHIRLERLLSYSEHEAASVASMVCNAEEGRKDGEGRWVHQSRRCFCIVASIPDGVTSIGRH